MNINEAREQLAAHIARAIFRSGDAPQSPCTRIQFKGGSLAAIERNQGGLCEDALVGVIQNALAEYDERPAKAKMLIPASKLEAVQSGRSSLPMGDRE